jgi:hypothetical protein
MQKFEEFHVALSIWIADYYRPLNDKYEVNEINRLLSTGNETLLIMRDFHLYGAYPADDVDEKSPTQVVSTVTHISDPQTPHKQSITNESPLGKIVACHLIDKSLLRTKLGSKRRQVDDDSNLIYACNLIHGHIDGSHASGNLSAVIRPVLQPKFDFVDDRFVVFVDICYKLSIPIEDINNIVVPHLKSGFQRINDASFSACFRLPVLVARPKRFLYCAAWKFNNSPLTTELKLASITASDEDAQDIIKCLAEDTDDHDYDDEIGDE